MDKVLKQSIERIDINVCIINLLKENGIKCLLFDLDNTIILDLEEDSEYYREALENAGFSDDYFYGIYQVIDDYDKAITEENPYYNEKEMLDFIKERYQIRQCKKFKNNQIKLSDLFVLRTKLKKDKKWVINYIIKGVKKLKQSIRKLIALIESEFTE